MPDTPEQRARRQIDAQLIACGWVVQDYRQFNPAAGRGIALCETPLKTGPCCSRSRPPWVGFFQRWSFLWVVALVYGLATLFVELGHLVRYGMEHYSPAMVAGPLLTGAILASRYRGGKLFGREG